MTARPRLHLTLLREKRPGHYRQVEALAGHIGVMADTTTEGVDVHPTRWENKHLRRFISGLIRKDPITWARRLYGLDLDRLTPPDVIIACARPTIAAGLLLKAHFGAKLIYVGRLNGFDPALFDLILVPSPRYAHDASCAYAPIPCLADPSRLPPPRLAASAADLQGLAVSLFIGGPTRHYQYDDADWASLGETVRTLRRDHGVIVGATTSRRTPEAALRLCADLAASGDLAVYVDYRTAGPGSAGCLLSADVLIVTEDSMSMAEEAASSGRPVIALKPRPRTRDGSFATEVMAAMAAEGAMKVAPINHFDAAEFVRLVTTGGFPLRDRQLRVAEAVAPVLGLDATIFEKARQAPASRDQTNATPMIS